MRRILTILVLFVCFTSFAIAQKYTVYCQVSYIINNQFSYSAVVLMDDNAYIIKDKKGKVKEFKTFIAILNYMSKLGWKLEPIQMKDRTAKEVFIMSKQVSTDIEANKGIKEPNST